MIDAVKRLPAVGNSKELTNFKKLLPNILEDYIKSDLEDKLEPVEEVKREITEHVSKTEEEVEDFLTENQLHLEDDEFFSQESYILYSKWRSKLKSKIKMQTIEPCQICIQVTELSDEIVRLKEHVSWLDSEILDLEKEVDSLDDKLTSIYPNLIRKKSS